MNLKTKKILMAAVIVALVVALVVGAQYVMYNRFAATVSVVSMEKTSTDDNVDTYTIKYSDGSSYQFTVTNGTDGQDGADGKNGQDGADADKVSIQEIYQSYVAEYGEIDYADFLANYLQLSTDNSTVINQCLLSSMKVYTEFCVTSSGNRPYQSATKSVSVQCGSAVIYQMNDDVTYIVTNYHVVYNQSANSDNGGNIAKKIVGYLYGSEGEPSNSGTTENGYTVYDYGNYGIELTYCGGSVEYDLAVLKVDTSALQAINANVQAVKLADDYYVGETAIAIGNPENEGISATQGIVSIDNEYIQLQIDSTTRNYRSIRIDTAIYGGSSGGGLFNANGKLIGITNAGNDEDQNINYAIPVSIVKGVVANILDYYDGTHTTSAYKITLGVTVEGANSKYVYDTAAGYGQIQEDVVIKSVVADSVAAGWGLQADDVIQAITVNGTTYTLNRYFDIGDILLNVRAGDVIAVKYLRGTDELTTADYQIKAADLNAIN